MKLSPTEAAEVIGCSVNHVRSLIASGRIKAEKIANPGGGSPHLYRIDRREAERFRDAPRDPRGWVRGRARK